MNWECLRSDEMAAAIEKSGGLCILPIGCMERHGPHMPLGTDSLQAKTHVELAAEMEDVVVFPTTMWLGDMCSVKGHPRGAELNHGAISLNPHTLLTVLEELCDEIARNGFRKILIVNCHGGNIYLLNYFFSIQSHKIKNYATMRTNSYDNVICNADLIYEHFLENRKDYPMLTDSDMEVLKGFAQREDGFGGGHAHFMETAWMMGAYPELIATDRFELESGYSTGRSDYLSKIGVSIERAWGANFPYAYDGHPSTGCTETIGQAFNLYSARRLANIFKVLKEDEECVKIATGQ